MNSSVERFSKLPPKLKERLKKAFLGERFETDDTVLTRLCLRSILSTEQALALNALKQHEQGISAE